MFAFKLEIKLSLNRYLAWSRDLNNVFKKANMEESRGFQRAGHTVGIVVVCLKPVAQYAFYFLMIAYECYDCVSDGMNVYQYSEGAYRAFFFSLVVSVLCALSACFGYILLIIGLSKTLHDHRTEKNNTTKLGKLIVFISLFCEVCLEESIQSIVLYYFVIRCSVLFSFWKISMFVCIALSLFLAGHTFFKGAYVWFKKRDSLSRKYPSCLSPCYNAEPSHILCIPLCIFGTILALGLFALNVTTLVNIIKHSEVDVPHVVLVNRHSPIPAVNIIPVKDLVKSNGTLVKRLPCSMQSKGVLLSHFHGDPKSFNCSSAIIEISLAKKTKKLEYMLQYCYNQNHTCNSINATNITLALSHDLCSKGSIVLVFWFTRLDSKPWSWLTFFFLNPPN